jgi:phosphoribosylglycinamide formyltransferase-1
VNRALGVLISGRGSNLKAIINAIEHGRLDARIAVVISNRADAPGLDHAITAGIETLVLNHQAYATREDYDRALVAELKSRNVDLVCLAGFMRLLSPVFVDAFPDRILNIHPSLLPKYPGLHPQQQALDDGATESGATVHSVNKDLDAGRVVLQQSVPVRPGDTAETLAARIPEIEHDLYPRAIEQTLAKLDGTSRLMR